MKDNKYKVIIIILLVVIVCLGGYIVYDAINAKNSQTTDNEVNENNNNNINNNDNQMDNNANNAQNNSQNTVVKYDLDKAEKLLANYFLGDTGPASGFIEMVEDDKIYLAIRNSNKKQMSCAEAYKGNKEFKFYESYGEKAVKDGESFFGCIEKPYVIDYSELNLQYQKLFGSNQSVPKQSMPYGMFVYYYYDVINNRFIQSDCRCGGDTVVFKFYSIKTAEIINNELVVKTRYADVEPSENGSQIELINGNLGQLENKLYENSNQEIKQEVLLKYKDKLKVKTFTFDLDNGNYVLKNIEG